MCVRGCVCTLVYRYIRVCAHVCAWVYAHVCPGAHMGVCTCMWRHACVHGVCVGVSRVCAHVHGNACARVCAGVHGCARVCVQMCARVCIGACVACTGAHMGVCMYVCMHVCVQGVPDFQNALRCKLHKAHTHKAMVTLRASETFPIFSSTVPSPMLHSGYEITGKVQFAGAPKCGEPRLPCQSSKINTFLTEFNNMVL